MSSQGESRWKAVLFVAWTLLLWLVLSVLTAVIFRLVYGTFNASVPNASAASAGVSSPTGLVDWFPPIDFGHWHWVFKAVFLASTLLTALWVSYRTVFPPVDAPDRARSDANVNRAPADDHA